LIATAHGEKLGYHSLWLVDPFLDARMPR